MMPESPEEDPSYPAGFESGSGDGDAYDYDIDESFASFDWTELGPSLSVYSITFLLGIVGNILILVTTLGPLLINFLSQCQWQWLYSNYVTVINFIFLSNSKFECEYEFTKYSRVTEYLFTIYQTS
jgi:hypothetical protein